MTFWSTVGAVMLGITVMVVLLAAVYVMLSHTADNPLARFFFCMLLAVLGIVAIGLVSM